MPSPQDQQLIAALDIGSSKVSALIVTRDDDGRLRVLGTGQRESRGVKRGYVTDMEASEVAVREAVGVKPDRLLDPLDSVQRVESGMGVKHHLPAAVDRAAADAEQLIDVGLLDLVAA